MSDWSTRDATLEDAAYVFDHVWESGAIELSGFGVDRDNWLDACIEMIAAGHCVVFERLGQVQALFGLLRESTWFQAVDGVDMTGLTRHMRKAVPTLMKRVQGTNPSIYSLCVNSCADRWFKLFGFIEDKQYHGKSYGGRVERRFVGVGG